MPSTSSERKKQITTTKTLIAKKKPSTQQKPATQKVLATSSQACAHQRQKQSQLTVEILDVFFCCSSFFVCPFRFIFFSFIFNVHSPYDFEGHTDTSTPTMLTLTPACNIAYIFKMNINSKVSAHFISLDPDQVRKIK